jgi:hypothetical protein
VQNLSLASDGDGCGCAIARAIVDDQTYNVSPDNICFLDQMARVAPWAAQVALIAPYYPEGRTGRPPFALETMLRVHLSQTMVQPVGPGHGRSIL